MGLGEGDLAANTFGEAAFGESTLGESTLAESTLGESALGESTLVEGDLAASGFGESAWGVGGFGESAATPEMRRTDDTTAEATFDTMPLRLQRERLGVLGATSAYAELASKSLSVAGDLPFGDCGLGEGDLTFRFLGEGGLAFAARGDVACSLLGAGEGDVFLLLPDPSSSSAGALEGVVALTSEARLAAFLVDAGAILAKASLASKSSSDSSKSISASICLTRMPVEERRGALAPGFL